MYCKKCGLEIQGGTETVCPLCNTALEESPALEQGAVSDESSDDQKLREMISDIERTITTSFGSDEKSIEPKREEQPFDLEGALTGELSAKEENVASARPAETTAGGYEKNKAVMEQTPAGIHHAPLPIAEPPRRSAIKNSAAVLLILGVVAAGIAAGYLFSPKEPPAVRTAAPVRRITPPDAPKAAAVALPAPQQPREMPAAPSVAPPAAPGQEPATAEKVEPVKQEQVPSAVEPVKTAAVQIPQTAPAPPSAQPPAAEQNTFQPPQKPAEQPKMAKAAAPGFYSVNVGSFKLKASTDRVCRDLKKNGYAPAVETVTLNDGNTWYRVTVGSFATHDEAAVFGRELESKTKIKAMVVKRK